jgi:hypothetical protein
MKSTLSEHQRRILILCFKEKFLTSQELLCEFWGLRGKERNTPQYACGHSSLSRTLTRLWRRKLLHLWKGLTIQSTGVTLTKAGRILAARIIGEQEEG